MHEDPTFDHTWRRLEEEAILVKVRIREPTSIPDYTNANLPKALEFSIVAKRTQL